MSRWELVRLPRPGMARSSAHASPEPQMRMEASDDWGGHVQQSASLPLHYKQELSLVYNEGAGA